MSASVRCASCILAVAVDLVLGIWRESCDAHDMVRTGHLHRHHGALVLHLATRWGIHDVRRFLETPNLALGTQLQRDVNTVALNALESRLVWENQRSKLSTIPWEVSHSGN